MVDPFSPFRLGGLTLRNRFLRTAAFEGMSPGGAPSPALVAHHRAMAAGGVAMTTVAYCSVSADGRTYGHQLLMRPDIVPALRELTDAVHAEGAAASLQLGHCGYFASKSAIGGRPIGPSRVFNTYGLSFARPMTEADIARVTDDFARAATLAHEAGFDAVELHAGHGYLLSQFLSPFTNRRQDAYGGPLENRLRFPADVVRRVRDTLPPSVPVLVKTNLRDGFRRGLDLPEALDVARAFESAGATALVATGGFVSRTPFYMLRGEVPVREMVKVQDRAWRKVGLTLFGHIFVRPYPFTELFFLEDARHLRAAVRLPLVLVGGICTRANITTALAEGFDLLALGRPLIADPTFINRLASGDVDATECDHCNACIAEMDRGGVKCVCLPRPPA